MAVNNSQKIITIVSIIFFFVLLVTFQKKGTRTINKHNEIKQQEFEKEKEKKFEKEKEESGNEKEEFEKKLEKFSYLKKVKESKELENFEKDTGSEERNQFRFQKRKKNIFEKRTKKRRLFHKIEIKKTDLRLQKKKFQKERKVYANSKIIRFEDEEEQITIYGEREIEKAEIEIRRKELLIQRTEFEIEKKNKEMAKKERVNNERKNKEKDEKTKKELKENETKKEEKEEKGDQIFKKSRKLTVEKLKKELKKEKQYLQIKKEIIQDEGKVDLVYTWGGITGSMDIRNRYNYELQFSLRSVDKYMPWANKIYILINKGTTYPYWLKKQEELEKIVILDRCQFFENPEHCPTNNSFAVYSVAHKIPGLSNKFVLIDDDFFFNQPVPEDYFFTANGLPKVYHKRKFQQTYKDDDEALPIAKERGYPLWKYARFSHIPKSNRRDFILKFEEKYPTFLEFVQSHRVRHNRLAEDLSMIYFEFYYQENLMKKLSVEESKFHQLPHRHKNNIAQQFRDNFETLLSEDIIVFNQNDNYSPDQRIYKKQRKVLWKFYNRLYPEVPDFEIPNPDHEANS
ncbi:hypothetical protein M0812_26664 [Anaeramoeba flamelloides]|uniref:Stealth protein CR2 conserved region 2 domain-containing protein n=1 Tax=Anaeramoeba flamelloides TaxID=1746091 RepID=A0AAV7YDP6_9EUKA|nr:hypothetical protein M0812_26664 [Anaeramoeba flamelloides]